MDPSMFLGTSNESTLFGSGSGSGSGSLGLDLCLSTWPSLDLGL